MKEVLNRLLLWHKFALMGLFGIVLVAVPLLLFINESNKAINATSLEAQGLTPIRAVQKVVLLAQQHRGMSALVLSGNDAMQAQRAGKQQEVEKAFAAADVMMRQVGNPAIAKLWQDAQSHWAPLAGKVTQRSLSAKESFAEHTGLIAQLLKVNELLSDHYGLSLDPDADSYYLINAALDQSPSLMETLGRMRAKGSAMLTVHSGLLEDRAAMIALVTQAQNRYDDIRNSLEKSIAANPALKTPLTEPLQTAIAVGSEVLQLTQEQVIKPEQLSYAGPDYFAKVTEALNAQVRFYDAAIDQLDQLLKAHETRLMREKYLLIGGVLALSALVALIGYLISRSITVPLAEAVSIAKRVAAGDLTARIVVDSDNETGQLLQALKEMNESLVRIVAEVRGGTETIATASNQIAAGNMDLSSRTEQQASSLEETAASMEEITGTVKQSSENARAANQLALSASEVAGKGGTMVSNVVETMGSINESSKKIVDIISVIDSIAFQTNILALNAAVEAARAGEQGKGFAVVATEVRNLAQRSAGAAKEIKELINDSVDKVEAGARLVNETGATMQEIVVSIKHVSDIIGEITTASDEQTSGIEQVNQAISQMDEVTQQNAALVEEAAAAAAALKEQAQNLAQVVSVFKLDSAQADATHMTEKAGKAQMMKLTTDAGRAAKVARIGGVRMARRG